MELYFSLFLLINTNVRIRRNFSKDQIDQWSNSSWKIRISIWLGTVFYNERSDSIIQSKIICDVNAAQQDRRFYFEICIFYLIFLSLRN